MRLDFRIIGKLNGNVILPRRGAGAPSFLPRENVAIDRNTAGFGAFLTGAIKRAEAPALHHCLSVGASDLTALRNNLRGQRGALGESALRRNAYDGSPGRHGIPEAAVI